MKKELPIVYFKSLKLKGINCFKGDSYFDFSDKNGNPAHWTVILGNNNTGKTTLLRYIADLEPTEIQSFSAKDKNDNTKNNNDEFENIEIDLAPLNMQRNIYSGLDISENFQDNKFSFVKSILLSSEDGFSFKNSAKDLDIGKTKWNEKKWEFTPFRSFSGSERNELGGLQIYSYGVNRRIGSTSISTKEKVLGFNSRSLFDSSFELTNTEEWLIQLDYANKNEDKKAKISLEKIKTILCGNVFPDILDFRFISTNNANYVEFQTKQGWIQSNKLGYGYQSSMAWLTDFMKKMFERYPDSDNPLEESAVVLVDEIDLHLHPEWQRKIIKELSGLFPSTQFIVTTHSPLIIQSLENFNVIILKDSDNGTIVEQLKDVNYVGWSVEEILEDLLGLEETRSKTYLEIMKKLNNALDNDNIKDAKYYYLIMDKMLHPRNSLKEILKIQTTGLWEND